MIQREAKQYLRAVARIRNANSGPKRIYDPICIHRCYSTQTAEHLIDPPAPPSETTTSSSKPSTKTKSRKVLPQGTAPFSAWVLTSVDLLPFDPPPGRPKRSPPVPIQQETALETVFPPSQQGPIPLRIRKPFPVNQSWDTLHNFYTGLFGFEDYIERGYITKALAWQSITYKSYNHGVDPYNEKLAHLGTAVLLLRG
jgi:hypothetical protein